MHYNCLIVDDETELAKMTAEYFQMFDVSAKYVETAKECYKFLEENTVDVILLDINLQEGTGFDICKKIREDMQLPILFISARQSDDDILVALSIGGDDYIKKPYSLSVLLAKVKVVLKRANLAKSVQTTEMSTQSTSNKDADDEDELKLDDSTMTASYMGKKTELKAKEYALLKCLYEHKNTIVKKEVLFDEVWGDTFYSDGTLNVHIRKLREKLEDDPNEPQLIKTIWGTGYILKLGEKGEC